ncbi:HU family DNA-binding protein [Streptomyces omiyaensis]|uniref:HU family DNA-binding protein n=1 Tax=Streptomyces omiyaensis TaxID=68247 RepID=UPI0036F8E1F6
MTRRIIGPVTATTIEQLLSAELDLTSAEASRAVHLVFQTITTATAAGHTAAIPGFGEFTPYEVTGATLGARSGALLPASGDLPTTAQPYQGIRFQPYARLSEIVRDRDLIASIRAPKIETGRPA